MEPAVNYLLSLSEYDQLSQENRDTRYEYHDGEVFAMAGGDPKHGFIANNIGRLLANALFSKDCIVGNSDVRYHVASANKSFYPDVSVVCGPPERSDQDPHALTNPIIIVAVLSASTEAFDRGDKFLTYSQLPSLREYVLVKQDEWLVETRYRSAVADPWKLAWFDSTHANVTLHSLGITLPLAELYHRTEEL